MKISYNRDEDIMLIEVAPDRIDFAEEMGPIIVHFSEEGKPVLLEIIDASEFITSVVRSTMKARDAEPVEINY